MPPRTIDNLGSDVSERYAKDQHQSDAPYMKGAREIPSRTEIDVSAPFFPGELDTLLQAQPTHMSWGYFVAPKAYNEQRKRLFTFQITPTIGLEGKWEAQAQKILEKLQSLPPEEGASKDTSGSTFKQKSEPPAATQKKVLTALLTTIDYLNKLIIEINCKKSQYQKG